VSRPAGPNHHYHRIVDRCGPRLLLGIGLDDPERTTAEDKTLGAHPYLTVPAHTRYAREMLGSNAFLAPERKVVLSENDEQARTKARSVRADVVRTSTLSFDFALVTLVRATKNE
jgi:hypothetical protein